MSGRSPAQVGPAARPSYNRVTGRSPVEERNVAGRVEGAIREIDAQGNLITDITSELLAHAPRDESVVVRCDEHETMGLFDTCDGQPDSTLVAVFDAAGRLRLSIVGDSAAMMLGVRVGEKVTVRW
jgi:S-adenosylmethionine hydrolase